jgi:polo-like kinase 1
MENLVQTTIMIKEKIRDDEQPGFKYKYKTYQRGKLIGKGGFAKCYEMVSDDTNILHACKVVEKISFKRPGAKKLLLSEIKIHKSLKHQNICNFHHYFEDPEHIYILLELCQNKSLSNLL